MSKHWLANRFIGLAAVALLCWLGAAPVHADGIFTPLAGSWSGTGTISFNSGSRERIRCRANYSPSEGGAAMRLDLRCASDSYKFELSSSLTATGGSISGTWSENTRQVSGSITGRGTSESMTVTAISVAFSAFLSVSTRGNRQNISIQSPGSEMSEVTISLARAARR